MLGGGEVCFAEGFVSLGLRWLLDDDLKGVPLLPLYTWGAGLHDGVQVSYGIGVLVGYNCSFSVQGRSNSILKLHVVLRNK